MFDAILKHYFKLTRKQHLIPFVEGLSNLGRPVTVFFPNELIEQGLGLLLSGLNNTLAIQSNPQWIWPYWLERQQDPHAVEFIPTGVNVMTANLSRRTWTSIGIPGSDRESMVDPVGMLTPYPFGWSILPYIRFEGRDFFPPRLGDRVHQDLEDKTLPIVVTEYRVSKKFIWRSRAMTVRAGGEELVSFSTYVESTTSEPLTITVGFAIRPYNSLTIGHINRLKFKNSFWRVNRKPGLLLPEEPDRICVSDRHRGDPMVFAGNQRVFSGQSRSGILSGVSEYDVELKPGESRVLQGYCTLAKVSDRPNLKFQNLDNRTFYHAERDTKEMWRQNRERGLNLSLPDKALERAFYAVKNHIHVFDDEQFFTPGTFFYHEHWIRDSAFIALAFENLGFSKEVAQKIPGFLGTRQKDGFFRSQNGEWDSNGQVMFTLVNHVRCGGDPNILVEAWPALLHGARWLDAKRKKDADANVPHAGLLPAGISAEHFGPNDHYFWDNFWGLAGLKQLHWAALRFQLDGAERLGESLEEFRQDVHTAMDIAMERAGNSCLPCSPYRNLDSAAIGNLVAVSPLDLFAPDEAWVKPTADYLANKYLHQGLFFQPIIHTGLNVYLTVQLARVLLALDDPRVGEILAAILKHATPTYTWPEAIHPRTGGGCMGDGDHGWAASEFLSLVRELLVREQSGELFLGAGIPREWYREGMTLSLTGAPTSFGRVDYSLKIEPCGLVLDWRIDRLEHQDPAPTYFLLPHHVGFTATPVYRKGPHRAWIRLSGQEGRHVFARKDVAATMTGSAQKQGVFDA